MSFYEPRCHVCGAMLGGHHMEYNMGSAQLETCAGECEEIYYTDPDKEKNDE